MLYLIGLGLVDDDITLKGMEAMKECDLVCIELYTNKWMGDLKRLEEKIGRKIRILSRQETESDFLLWEAKKKKIALLVSGDPLTATTHFELVFEAKKRGIEYEIMHAPSIYTSVAETGLQLYKFGRATTLVYKEANYLPSSPYEMAEANKKMGLHTLVLLDIREDRQMSVKEGLHVLMEIERGKKKGLAGEDSFVIACTKVGSKEMKIRYAPIKEMIEDKEMQETPAVLVIPGELNFKEEEALELWKQKRN